MTEPHEVTEHQITRAIKALDGDKFAHVAAVTARGIRGHAPHAGAGMANHILGLENQGLDLNGRFMAEALIAEQLKLDELVGVPTDEAELREFVFREERGWPMDRGELKKIVAITIRLLLKEKERGLS